MICDFHFSKSVSCYFVVDCTAGEQLISRMSQNDSSTVDDNYATTVHSLEIPFSVLKNIPIYFAFTIFTLSIFEVKLPYEGKTLTCKNDIHHQDGGEYYSNVLIQYLLEVYTDYKKH